jgi:hypothetical protein
MEAERRWMFYIDHDDLIMVYQKYHDPDPTMMTTTVTL